MSQLPQQSLLAFRNLLERNQMFTSKFKEEKDPHAIAIGSLAEHFVGSFSYETITRLRKVDEIDSLLMLIQDEILPEFLEFFESKGDYFMPPLKPELLLFYTSIIHELLIRAVRREEIIKWDCFPSISIPAFYPWVYQMHLKMYCIESDVEDQRQEEDFRREIDEYWERRNSDLSIDADKENSATLAPAEKARVLRNAIQKYNELGHLTSRPLGTSTMPIIIESPLEWQKADLAMAQKFFTEHRNMSVFEFMTILEQCADLANDYMQPGEGKFDPHWHARRGVNVRFALAQFAKIVNELGLTMPAPSI